MPLTMREIDARMEAYDQAILSLEASWTDDPVERQQGEILAKSLTAQKRRWYDLKVAELEGEK